MCVGGKVFVALSHPKAKPFYVVVLRSILAAKEVHLVNGRYYRGQRGTYTSHSQILYSFRIQHKTFHTSAGKKPVSADTHPPMVFMNFDQDLFASQDQARGNRKLKTSCIISTPSD